MAPWTPKAVARVPPRVSTTTTSATGVRVAASRAHPSTAVPATAPDALPADVHRRAAAIADAVDPCGRIRRSRLLG